MSSGTKEHKRAGVFGVRAYLSQPWLCLWQARNSALEARLLDQEGVNQRQRSANSVLEARVMELETQLTRGECG